MLNSVSSAIVSLGWRPSVDNVGVTLYKIYRDGVHIDSLATLLYTGLLPATDMDFSINSRPWLRPATNRNSAMRWK